MAMVPSPAMLPSVQSGQGADALDLSDPEDVITHPQPGVSAARAQVCRNCITYIFI